VLPALVPLFPVNVHDAISFEIRMRCYFLRMLNAMLSPANTNTITFLQILMQCHSCYRDVVGLLFATDATCHNNSLTAASCDERQPLRQRSQKSKPSKMVSSIFSCSRPPFQVTLFAAEKEPGQSHLFEMAARKFDWSSATNIHPLTRVAMTSRLFATA
jgi:hypothetical protein